MIDVVEEVERAVERAIAEHFALWGCDDPVCAVWSSNLLGDTIAPMEQQNAAEIAFPGEMIAKFPIVSFFRFDHLPDHLQAISRPFAALALQMAAQPSQPAETAAGLRKLLEAKDCAVRAGLL
jgi:hypothetical protein